MAICTECAAAARLDIELLHKHGNLVDDNGKPLPRVHLLLMATAALRCAYCDPSRSAFLARRGRAVTGVSQTDAAEYGALSADESRRDFSPRARPPTPMATLKRRRWLSSLGHSGPLAPRSGSSSLLSASPSGWDRERVRVLMRACEQAAGALRMAPRAASMPRQ